MKLCQGFLGGVSITEGTPSQVGNVSGMLGTCQRIRQIKVLRNCWDGSLVLCGREALHVSANTLSGLVIPPIHSSVEG